MSDQPDLLEKLKAALADRYQIEHQIGQGAMATVYLARDLKYGRNVAVKVLRPELAASIGPDRFFREIEIAAKLQHPQILPLYESGEAQGFLFYVMPVAEGESLRDRLTREKQLPVEEAVRIASEVAGALGYAHSLGFVHRDIKPANILLHHGQAVVADFGVARAVTAASGQRLTSTGIAVGTPAYMSPEQAGGDQNLDGRSDIYALACVLYEALAGRAPFEGSSTPEIMAKHASTPVPNVRQVRPTVPEYVESAMMKALAKLPADRFATATELADALAGRVPVARHVRERERARRQRMYGIAAALVAGGIAIAAVSYWSRTNTQRDAIEPSQQLQQASQDSMRAQNARQTMLTLKAQAQAAGAALWADSTYDRAARAEQAGELHLTAGHADSAALAFDEAIVLLRRSLIETGEGRAAADVAAPATRNRITAPQRADADTEPPADTNSRDAIAAERARKEMVDAKARILGSESARSANARYVEGLQMEAVGLRQMRLGVLDSAEMSFRQATNLYELTASQIAIGCQREAEAARQSVAEAKASLDDAVRTTPAYREASSLERIADSAYAVSRCDAARHYEVAYDAYSAVVSEREASVDPVEREILSLITRYEQSIEARDSEQLRALFKRFDQNQWSSFFQTARDIKVQIDVERMDSNPANPNADLLVNIDYINNENRQVQSSQRFLWTFESVNGRWVIAEIVLQG